MMRSDEDGEDDDWEVTQTLYDVKVFDFPVSEELRYTVLFETLVWSNFRTEMVDSDTLHDLRNLRRLGVKEVDMLTLYLS